MDSLKIPLSEAEGDYDLNGFTPRKINKVFRALVTAQEGQDKKITEKGLKRLRFIPQGQDKKYISRYGLAEYFDYSPDYITQILKPMKITGESLYLFLLDIETDENGTKCYRIDEEKIAKSIKRAIENFFFELTEEEKELIDELVAEDIYHPQIYWDFGDQTHYTLLHAFISRCSRAKEADTLSDILNEEKEETFLDIMKRLEPLL
jgi:hypothetical protein